mmetsp:Transcript_1210/g.7959  ORF Transcript_1210/g.7959 Transcript_1210/m.7959 type:complete len:192 (-) Transcript_1210:1377-1952(-)
MVRRETSVHRGSTCQGARVLGRRPPKASGLITHTRTTADRAITPQALLDEQASKTTGDLLSDTLSSIDRECARVVDLTHMFQDSLLELDVVGLGEMVGNALVKDKNSSFSPRPENYEASLHQPCRGNVLWTHNLCVFGFPLLTDERHRFAPGETCCGRTYRLIFETHLQGRVRTLPMVKMRIDFKCLNRRR